MFFLLIAGAASAVAVGGGTLKLAWKDCGSGSTHGKVSSLTPDTLPLGETTQITGSGTVDEDITGGSLVADVMFGPVKKQYTGDLCSKTIFPFPLGIGSLTFGGLNCPVSKGNLTVPTSALLSAKVPVQFARAQIQMKATSTNGDSLLCLEIDTAPEDAHSEVVI
jgi:hypothetical protein